MKLVYIANARIPTEKAHGIQIMKMCGAFGELKSQNSKVKTEVELVLPRRFNSIKQYPFEYYGVERNFKITKLPVVDLTGIVPRLGFWMESLTFSLSTLIYLSFRRYDVIYSRDEFAAWLLSFFKKSVFWEAHWGQQSFAVRGVLKRCRGIVTITKAGREFYINNLGAHPDKVIVAPDAVDLDKFEIRNSKFEIRQQLNLPADKFIVAYTGHLYEWKGASVLLETARNMSLRVRLRWTKQSQGDRHGAEAPRDDSGVLFVFVGGTESDIAKFREQAKDLDNVLFLGHKPHSEIPKYLAAADVLILPNSGKNEISRLYTSPLKLFEYMAAGKPIAASDLPSIREVLNEHNAILVEPDNPQALAAGIERILQDEALGGQLAAQALLDVQNYTWQKRAQKILQRLTRV